MSENGDKYIEAAKAIKLESAKSLEKIKSFGCSVPTTADNSEFFLGEYVEECKKKLEDQNREDKNTVSKNPFINSAAFYPTSKEERSPNSVKTSCEILTLNDPQDLQRFNFLLNAKSDPRATIELKVMEKQYNQELKTWQVFAIYDTITPINLIK